MLGTRALLLAGLAVAATVPVAVLFDEEGRETCGPRVLPSPCGRVPDGARFELDAVPAPAENKSAAPLRLALPDPRDAEIERLREALLAAAEENGRLRDELRELTRDYEDRLDRGRLEDDLHELLRYQFPQVVAAFDPNAEESPEDEVVAVLMQVADWLGQQGGDEEAATRPIHLAELRNVVSDSDILALSARLPHWNEQLALAPCPQTWWAENPPRSGPTLMRAYLAGGEVIVVPVVELDHQDPRIRAAHEARDDVQARRSRDLAGLVGLPAGVLD